MDDDDEDVLGLPPARHAGAKMIGTADLFLGLLGCGELIEAARNSPTTDARFASALMRNHVLIAFPDGKEGDRDRALLRQFLAANLTDLHAAARLLAKVDERRTRA